MTPENTPETWRIVALGAVILAAWLLVVLVRNRKEAPEYTPERPALPKDFKPAPTRKRSGKDRLVLAQLRAHAREVHQLDQAGPR